MRGEGILECIDDGSVHVSRGFPVLEEERGEKGVELVAHVKAAVGVAVDHACIPAQLREHVFQAKGYIECVKNIKE